MSFDPELLRKILAITRKAESGDRDFTASGLPVRSPAGAMYGMQVMPSTAADPGFGVRPAAAQTPDEYNRVGTDLMSTYLQKYNNPGKAWAAYHSGAGNLNKWTQRYGDNWQQGLGPQGRKYVTSNLSALGLKTLPTPTPAPQEAPMEDDVEDTPEDNGFGVKDVMAEYRQTSQSLADQAKAEAEARKQQFEAATATLAKQRFGPSLAERLFALSAAIGRPRYQHERGFGAVMGDLAAPLNSLLSGKRDAEEQRAAALQKLRDTYTNDTLSGQRSALEARTKMLPTLATLARQPRDRVLMSPSGDVINAETNTPVGMPSVEPGPAGVAIYTKLPSGARYYDKVRGVIRTKP